MQYDYIYLTAAVDFPELVSKRFVLVIEKIHSERNKLFYSQLATSGPMLTYSRF